MKWINPIYFIKFLVSMFREASNWRFYWKKIVELEKSGQLAKRGLRVDAIKRIYFVKNIQPEALLYGEVEDGGVEQFEKQFVADAIRLHNDLFIVDGSIELVKAETERIQNKDYYAYLIWIGFKFRKLRFWNLVYVVLYILAAWFLVRLCTNVWPYFSVWAQHWLKAIHVIQ